MKQENGGYYVFLHKATWNNSDFVGNITLIRPKEVCKQTSKVKVHYKIIPVTWKGKRQQPVKNGMYEALENIW